MLDVEQMVPGLQSPPPETIAMACADEEFAVREFTLLEVDTVNGQPDYCCTHCGWLQASPRAGGQELLNAATWDSEEAKQAFAERVAQQPDWGSCLASAHAAFETSTDRSNGQSAAIESPRG